MLMWLFCQEDNIFYCVVFHAACFNDRQEKKPETRQQSRTRNRPLLTWFTKHRLVWWELLITADNSKD